MEFKELVNNIDKELYISLKNTFKSFLENDIFLIWETREEKKVYEVAISCKLARYIETYLIDQKFFEENYHLVLDTEYDRMWIDKIGKHIDWIGVKCWNKTDNIRPDIIIHNRWYWEEENNYCVFEVKKWKLNECDELKLEKMTWEELKFVFWYKYWIWISELSSNSIKVSLYQKWKFIEYFTYTNQT